MTITPTDPPPRPARSAGSSLAKTHANYSHDFWTPRPWLRWVGETFRRAGFAHWFDPCPGDWTPDRPSGIHPDLRWAIPSYVNHPGARGSTLEWWAKYLAERRLGLDPFIWCAFSVEQFRHMQPSALELPGWLVAPRSRVSFIWGGPDMEATPTRAARKHGQPMTQPGNWTAFWSTVEPAAPPVESIIIQTGR